MRKKQTINQFRNHVENGYKKMSTDCGGSFGEILCFELHDQTINPRMNNKTFNDGFCTGLTFKELASKWDINISFLGELIADHCKRL